jgi:hypothetical protein
MRAMLLCLSVAGCGFSARAASDGGNGVAHDDARPGADGDHASADARLCFGTTDAVCLNAPPMTPLVLPTGTFDTGVDTNCTDIVSGQCVLVGTQVIGSGALVAVGSRPLVIVAGDTIMLTGSIDVSSTISPRRTGAGANATGCAAAGTGVTDSGGAGGGAGGSFSSTGGTGGTGDLNMNHNPPGSAAGGAPGAAASAMHLRGGCPGGRGGDGDDPAVNPGAAPGGAPGDGGGAVRLIAGTAIVVSGSIFASGGGGGANTGNGGCATNVAGFEQGGGGGGTGGMIWLDAPSIGLSGATIAANGGAGGGGGGCYGGAPGGDGTTTAWNQRASGGLGEAADAAGNGGAGAAVGQTTNLDGQSSNSGAGGGGGSIGIVWLDGAVTGATQVSPAASPH